MILTEEEKNKICFCTIITKNISTQNLQGEREHRQNTFWRKKKLIIKLSSNKTSKRSLSINSCFGTLRNPLLTSLHAGDTCRCKVFDH